ncbi:hypothetical protein [Larkinella soli]|uniref:hypothetical protein n=1 Tax=Larkinella soli TaxID=1770527 RepID=UPI000FFC8BDC|nr:hypothetical protein [Larkinella soli]
MERLVREVYLLEGHGYYANDAIRNFLDRYDLLESELALDSAIRYYHRHRPKDNFPFKVRRRPASKVLPILENTSLDGPKLVA